MNQPPEEEVEVEELDVEEHAKKGSAQRAPEARRYVIRIDKQKYTVLVPSMKGREILELAEKLPPEQYKLTEKLHGGGAKTIPLDETVDFRGPGVERFMTMKRDQTEG
jgi:hypothetical protein